MKKILLCVLIAVLTVQIAYARDIKVTGKKLSIRSDTNIEAPLLRILPKEYVIEAIEGTEAVSADDEWIKVKDYDGLTGYVRTRFAEIVSDTEVPKTIEGRIAEKIINSVIPASDDILKSDKAFEQTSNDVEQNIVFIEGEGLHRVKISLKDLTRISCPGKIGDPIYSKDKQIEIVRGGEKDLFVKISPVQTAYGGVTKTTFSSFPREMFVECGNLVYNLSLIPVEDLTTQTIVFKSSFSDIAAAREFERAAPYETTITNLIKSAYEETLPEGYVFQNGNVSYSFKELDMRLRHSFQGYDYIVEDWEITSKLEEETEIEENVFIPVIKNPRALALTIPRLSFGESSRLIVIRLASNDEI